MFVVRWKKPSTGLISRPLSRMVEESWTAKVEIIRRSRSDRKASVMKFRWIRVSNKKEYGLGLVKRATDSDTASRSGDPLRSRATAATMAVAIPPRVDKAKRRTSVEMVTAWLLPPASVNRLQIAEDRSPNHSQEMKLMKMQVRARLAAARREIVLPIRWAKL